MLKKNFFFALCALYLSLPLHAQSQMESAISLFQQAEELYYERKYEQSEKLLNRIESDLCSSEKWVMECAETKILLASLKNSKREFESSLSLLDRAESMVVENWGPSSDLMSDIYQSRINAFSETGEFEAGRNEMEAAINYLETYDKQYLAAARIYLSAGNLLEELGNYPEAIDYYQKSLSSVSAMDNEMQVLRLHSVAYNNLALSYRMSGELAKAMESYHMALDATEELYGENHAEVGLIYNNIGTIHYLRGDYGQAADFFNRAGDLFLESFGEEHPNVALAYNNAAVIYIEMGNLERGSEILERAQQIKEKTLGTNHIDTAIGYSNLAHVYEQMGNHEKALENLQKSLRIRRQIYGDNHPSLVDVHRMTGDFYSRTGDQNSARDHYQSADTILRDRIDENHPDRSDFQFKIGRSFQVEGNLSDALSYFQLSLYRYTGEAITSRDEFDLHQVTYPRRFLNLLRHLGDVTLEIYEEEGREALLYDSHYYYRWAADVMHVVQTGYASEDSKLNLIEEYHSIFDQAVRVSHQLFEITGEQQWLDEILWFSEAGRSRIALELLNRAEARNFSGVPDSLVEQERKMSADIARFTQQIHEEMSVDNEENNDRLVAFRDSLFTARQNLLDFIQDLERRFPTYYQLKYDRNYADRGDIIDFLHENEVLVSYSVLDGEVSALIISSEGSEYIPLGPSDSLEEDVRAFNESVLVTEDRTQFIRLGRKLYSNLVEPVMKSVDAASVIIIPDGPLHYLPFDMLLTDNAPENGYVGMPYLVRDLSISHSPSATLLQKLREREQKRGSKLFAMAPFVESGVESDDIPATYRGEDTLSPLPLSGFEVRQIASVLSVEKGRFSGSSSVFTGRDATSKKLLSANLREFDFIHFATHAFINEEIPELSGILLNESDNTDGTLYVNDIYTLDLNADLVVLSACETGLGTHIRGEGIIGFTRAFLYAGASGLLVSLWRVNDQPTAELMVHFYEQLREEKNYGEALREAKLKLISKPQFAAPKNWAPFVLQGSV